MVLNITEILKVSQLCLKIELNIYSADVFDKID